MHTLGSHKHTYHNLCKNYKKKETKKRRKTKNMYLLETNRQPLKPETKTMSEKSETNKIENNNSTKPRNI